ncbi:hypothetical protein BDR26DRAFT_885038 [Obelidium mucronatum]|nr:hypothetical protein BDR26DRAFT_885038 [Obelidium mucronatum]
MKILTSLIGLVVSTSRLCRLPPTRRHFFCTLSKSGTFSINEIVRLGSVGPSIESLRSYSCNEFLRCCSTSDTRFTLIPLDSRDSHL